MHESVLKSLAWWIVILGRCFDLFLRYCVLSRCRRHVDVNVVLFMRHNRYLGPSIKNLQFPKYKFPYQPWISGKIFGRNQIFGMTPDSM